MSRLRRIELVEPSSHYSYFDYPSLFLKETSIFTTKALPFPSFIAEVEEYELVNRSPSPFELFDSVTDLIRIDQRPSISSCRRIQRSERLGSDIVIQSLSDRVSELESRFDRLVKINGGRDRKYTWTAEIKSPEKHGVDRKYKWIAEIKEGKKKEEGIEKKYKWTAEIKGKGGEGSRTYTFEASNGNDGDCSESKKKDKNKKDKNKKSKEENDTRLVEIEELEDHGAVVLRQVRGNYIYRLVEFCILFDLMCCCASWTIMVVHPLPFIFFFRGNSVDFVVLIR